MQDDKYYMNEALKMGQEALNIGEVPVGCVVINSKGEIVAKGRNHTKEFQDGTQHAEIVCINQLVEKHVHLSECILYVTCEPCIMCAEALKQCGITKIIYGCSNARFGGCGSVMTIIKSSLYKSNHEINYCYHSLMELEGLELLKCFFSMENEKAPEPNKKRKKEEK
ncbi:hypothetical protein ENUP19_0265G0025 [Entamoeba nuttalli]|uniref:Cytidine/deoxycytidylate deaminase family protein n=2 Tax=Entamoeba nuttalli TaxID=412467 RepID=K2GPT4_ENTNP|nr:cytidine/deoxycytidylate deaminase family protein [Entamoeba nuttalli P19]EKE36958.1 cytidine/deoxycytidylate deaminase family protein [Entamoeba nuttalli P19]|eukprot:XP_008860698.1 cytidine/deoxycytidylate deaminase family protein [Entamoeba nuttalli P19]